MLFLPLEENSLLFRLCLYYGLLVLLLELLVPLLFQHRVRIEIPRLALHAPAVPLSTREFQQRRLALQQQVAALQRALAETPRWSLQKRKQLLSASAAKNRPATSPSPSPSSSPLASPTSSVKVTRPKSSRKTSEAKRKIYRALEQDDYGDESRRRGENEESRPPLSAASAQKSKQSPMAMDSSLATRTDRRGGFSFNEVFEEEDGEEKSEDPQQEREDWTQAVNTRAVRRRESPTFSRRRPVRLVSEDVEGVGYIGSSEAATRLEALIGARRRQRANTSLANVVPPSSPVKNLLPEPVPAPAPATLNVEKPIEYSASHAPNPTLHGVPSPLRQQDKDKAMEEDEESKESEQSERLTDFQAFCASFAAGGTATARQAVAKRKHHEAFGSEDEQANGSTTTAQQSVDKRRHPRVLGQDMEQTNGDARAEAPQSIIKRTHYEAFGSDDEQAIDDAVAAEQIQEKRKHDQAFGTTEEQERPEEKTPRIARRISFGDEVDAPVATPSKEIPGERSNGKRNRKQAFGMIDDDDEDAEWRDSLAFRPHRFG